MSVDLRDFGGTAKSASNDQDKIFVNLDGSAEKWTLKFDLKV